MPSQLLKTCHRRIMINKNLNFVATDVHLHEKCKLQDPNFIFFMSWLAFRIICFQNCDSCMCPWYRSPAIAEFAFYASFRRSATRCRSWTEARRCALPRGPSIIYFKFILNLLKIDIKHKNGSIPSHMAWNQEFLIRNDRSFQALSFEIHEKAWNANIRG